ncbi:hypothetical protein RB195_003114 [Necator americanus]
MVIDVKPKIVLILGSLQSTNGPSMKCFWPEGGEKTYANYVGITVIRAEKGQGIEAMELQVSARNKELLRLHLILFKAWKDDILLPDLSGFRRTVRGIEKMSYNKDGPTVLVCASGVTRCGTYAAIDILLNRIAKEQKVGVQQTIEAILAQRYGCFQFIEHYKAIHDIVQSFCMATSSNLSDLVPTRTQKSASTAERSQ